MIKPPLSVKPLCAAPDRRHQARFNSGSKEKARQRRLRESSGSLSDHKEEVTAITQDKSRSVDPRRYPDQVS